MLRSLAVDGAASPMLRSLADASNATAALPNATYYGPVTDADLSRPGIFACYGLGIVAWHLLIYAVARSYPRQPRRAVPIACAVVGVVVLVLLRPLGAEGRPLVPRRALVALALGLHPAARGCHSTWPRCL